MPKDVLSCMKHLGRLSRTCLRSAGWERLLFSPRVLQIQLAWCIAEVSCPLLSCQAVTFCVMECGTVTFLTVLLKRLFLPLYCELFVNCGALFLSAYVFAIVF